VNSLLSHQEHFKTGPDALVDQGCDTSSKSVRWLLLLAISDSWKKA
jgi:hypothetical protein